MEKGKLGIIGGMGPQATQDFYQRILDRTDARRDQEHLPCVIVSDTLMPDRTAAILSGEGDRCLSRLVEDARALESLGCTAIAIPCNTSHYFADALSSRIGIPLVHMVRETVKTAAARPGVGRVGVLATDGTVRTGVYRTELEKLGLDAPPLPEEIQRLVMSIIYDEIKRGERGSREKFAEIDRCLHEMGCDAAILGCTELSVYRTYHRLPDYYVDAMDVLALRSIQACGYPVKA